jgi:hypothetical protein
MNLYTGERLPMERHEAIVRAAERRAVLLPAEGRSALAAWMAARLRAAADRLDGEAFEASRPVVVRSVRRPAP